MHFVSLAHVAIGLSAKPPVIYIKRYRFNFFSFIACLPLVYIVKCPLGFAAAAVVGAGSHNHARALRHEINPFFVSVDEF